MSEPIARHQLFEYNGREPFLVLNAPVSPAGFMDSSGDLLLHHWHEELEIVYVMNGESLHYIAGECIQALPGRLVVVNSGSPHNIILQYDDVKEPCIGAVVLIIHRQFLEEHFPQYRELYFTNEKSQARPEIADIMGRLSVYGAKSEYSSHDSLYAMGLVLQLLYYMCEEGIARRDAVDVNIQKNVERLKGILSYVENHYREPLSQAEVAEKFYFNRDYFSRYFKKYTGTTFTEYVTRYRLQKAKEELTESDRKVLTIALSNGFSDDRRFIETFKKYYGTTPLQFRKNVKNKGNRN